ncbi:MAG: hypothetical protein R2827_01945 [Bdellovibrionales bacterium]
MRPGFGADRNADSLNIALKDINEHLPARFQAISINGLDANSIKKRKNLCRCKLNPIISKEFNAREILGKIQSIYFRHVGYKKIFSDKFELFSKSECSNIAERVKDLKEHWMPNGSDPNYPYFYNLGAANYLIQDPEKYSQVVQRLNSILQESFRSEYQLILQKVAESLNAPTKFSSNLGLPGFHIYHTIPMPNGGSIHSDFIQPKLVQQFFDKNVDHAKCFSIVIPVELSKDSGIYFWRHCFNGAENQIFFQQQQKLKDLRPDKKITYSIGRMYRFNSFNFHQIAPNKNLPSDQLRITWQLHAVYHNHGYYLLFW